MPSSTSRKKRRQPRRRHSSTRSRVSLLLSPTSSRIVSTIRGRPLAAWLSEFIESLPELSGAPIRLSFLPRLTASRGRLLSGRPTRGTPVHAASFLRQRRIVLETALLAEPSRLRLILTHELFHFAWLRLGNPARWTFAAVLRAQFDAEERRELGESSDAARVPLRLRDVRTRSRRWRNYVCESFCDSAAWLFGGVRRHEFFLLPTHWRKRRASAIRRIGGFRV